MTRRLFLPSLFIAAAPLLLAAAPDVAPSAPLRLIEVSSVQGERQVGPAAILAHAVLGPPDAAVLGDPLALDHAGEQRGFARGDILRAGGATGITGVPAAIFCEAPHKGSVGKAMVGNMALGLVGALRPTHLDTRYCLFDSRSDGRFDRVVLIGAKGKGAAPFAIAPVRYQLIEGGPLTSDGTVQLRYAGPLDLADTLAFDLEVFANGRSRDVPHARHFVSIKTLPAYGVIGSAVVTILDYHPDTRIATIRMDHGLAPGHIVLPEFSRDY